MITGLVLKSPPEGRYVHKQTGPASTRKSRIDYREVLNDKDFALFAKLRDLRKTLAEQESVPAYAVFNNGQLAAMVQKRVTSKAALAAIEGVSAARIEKYGEAFLKLSLEKIPDVAENGEAARS